jgi:hypothetical protein
MTWKYHFLGIEPMPYQVSVEATEHILTVQCTWYVFFHGRSIPDRFHSGGSLSLAYLDTEG